MNNTTLIQKITLLLFVGLNLMVMPNYGQTYTLEQTYTSSYGRPTGTPIGIIDYNLLWTFNSGSWTSESFDNGPDGNLSTFGFIDHGGLTYIYGRTATDLLFYTTDDGDNWTLLYMGGFPTGESPSDMTCVDDNGTLGWYTMSLSFIYELTGTTSKTLVASIGSMNSICTNFTDTIYVSRLGSGTIRGYAIANWSSHLPLGNAGGKIDWKDNTLLSNIPSNVMQRSTASSGSWTSVITLNPSDQIVNCTWLTDASVSSMDLAVGSKTFDEIHVYRETVVVAPDISSASWDPASIPDGGNSTLTAVVTNSPTSVTADMSDFSLGTVSLTFVSGNDWEYVGTGLNASLGAHNVTIIATNSGGNDTDVATLTIYENAPVADFVGNPWIIEEFEDVSFTDLSTNNPTSWSWDFGDGEFSDIQDPIHMYYYPGTYTVTLEVANTGGSDTEIKIDYITVNAVMPPVAEFEGVPSFGNVPLTVVFNDLSLPGDWPIVTWDWDFGDGTTSDVQYPTHVYEEAGTYTVSLLVSDGILYDIETKTDYITVSPILGPTANFSGVPTVGIEPLNVSFTDESTQGTFLLISWFWDFGDGDTSLEQNPGHEYTSVGTYTVSLTVSDGNLNDVETKTDYIEVNPAMAPVAGFSGTPTSGYPPLTVNFTDESTFGFPIISWVWDFGDGTTSSEQNPQYIYENPGIYDVSLTIFDGTYSDTETKNDYVTVNAIFPTADFTSDVTAGQAPLEVHFTDLSVEGSYPITDYYWDFGDGSTSDDENPIHTYTNTGVYDVMLEVSDGGNLADVEVKLDYIDVITAITPVSGNNRPFIYPNPFRDLIYVSNLTGIEKLEILNAYGQQCKSMTAPENTNEIDMSGLGSGIYFVLIHKSTGILTFKVLKE